MNSIYYAVPFTLIILTVIGFVVWWIVGPFVKLNDEWVESQAKYAFKCNQRYRKRARPEWLDNP